MNTFLICWGVVYITLEIVTQFAERKQRREFKAWLKDLHKVHNR